MRRSRRSRAFRPTVGGLEHRICLDGDPVLVPDITTDGFDPNNSNLVASDQFETDFDAVEAEPAIAPDATAQGVQGVDVNAVIAELEKGRAYEIAQANNNIATLQQLQSWAQGVATWAQGRVAYWQAQVNSGQGNVAAKTNTLNVFQTMALYSQQRADHYQDEIGRWRTQINVINQTYDRMEGNIKAMPMGMNDPDGNPIIAYYYADDAPIDLSGLSA